MTDQALEAKFHSLADSVIGAGKASRLIEACWKLGAAKDVKAVVEAAKP
jgi:hypothetical protein